MKIMIVSDAEHVDLFRQVCKGRPEVTACSDREALEQLLVAEPTHVLLILDWRVERDHQGTLRDLERSAAKDQVVAYASWRTAEDYGLDPKKFLRLPFTWEELYEFLKQL